MKYYDARLPRPGDERWKSLEAEPILGGVRGWLLRRSVNHEKLGYGIIVDYYYDDEIMLVEFNLSKKLTRFKYPDAFDDGPLTMVYSIDEAYGFVSQDPDDKDMWKFFDNEEITMQGEFFDKWMTTYDIEQILSKKDIEMLNFQRDYNLGDDIPDGMSLYDIFPCTELPYILDFYNSICMLEIDLTPKSQAICLLKANVLCACQIVFGVPFWNQEGALKKFEDALSYLEEILQDEDSDTTFEFVEYYPVVIQKKTQISSREAELIFNVLEEYIQFAIRKGYIGNALDIYKI